MVEERIKKKNKESNEDVILNCIYYLMRKLKGHTIEDVLKMSIPQFFCLIEMIAKESEETVKASKKGRKGRKG